MIILNYENAVAYLLEMIPEFKPYYSLDDTPILVFCEFGDFVELHTSGGYPALLARCAEVITSAATNSCTMVQTLAEEFIITLYDNSRGAYREFLERLAPEVREILAHAIYLYTRQAPR